MDAAKLLNEVNGEVLQVLELQVTQVVAFATSLALAATAMTRRVRT